MLIMIPSCGSAICLRKNPGGKDGWKLERKIIKKRKRDESESPKKKKPKPSKRKPRKIIEIEDPEDEIMDCRCCHTPPPSPRQY